MLTGGTGRDRFVYEAVNEGGDRILDFNPNQDILDFRTLFNAPQYGASNVFRTYVRLGRHGNDTIVQIDTNGDRSGGFQPFVTLESVKPRAINSQNLVVN